MFDIGIFFAALGIVLLELTEASAVGLALYGNSGDPAAFLFVSLGVAAVLVPAAVVGSLISLLPIIIIRLVAGTLLLYFGTRLARSARRAVLRERFGFKGAAVEEHAKGLFSTAFSVGAVEAFEASIVLVALLPNSYSSTLYGLFTGVACVVVATYILKPHVRRVKEANMKIVVSALLLSFSFFWYLESVVTITDLMLVPFFIVFALGVRAVAHMYPSNPATAAHKAPTQTQ